MSNLSNLGNLSHPAFERRPSADNPHYGADCAAAIVGEVLNDLARKWEMPVEEFGKVIAFDVARAFEESPPLLARLSKAIADHLFLCLRGAQVIQDLAARGIRVRLDGAVLQARPKALVTESVSQRITKERHAIAAALKAG